MVNFRLRPLLPSTMTTKYLLIFVVVIFHFPQSYLFNYQCILFWNTQENRWSSYFCLLLFLSLDWWKPHRCPPGGWCSVEERRSSDDWVDRLTDFSPRDSSYKYCIATPRLTPCWRKKEKKNYRRSRSKVKKSFLWYRIANCYAKTARQYFPQVL